MTNALSAGDACSAPLRTVEVAARVTCGYRAQRGCSSIGRACRKRPLFSISAERRSARSSAQAWRLPRVQPLLYCGSGKQTGPVLLVPDPQAGLISLSFVRTALGVVDALVFARVTRVFDLSHRRERDRWAAIARRRAVRIDTASCRDTKVLRRPFPTVTDLVGTTIRIARAR